MAKVVFFSATELCQTLHINGPIGWNQVDPLFDQISPFGQSGIIGDIKRALTHSPAECLSA